MNFFGVNHIFPARRSDEDPTVSYLAYSQEYGQRRTAQARWVERKGRPIPVNDAATETDARHANFAFAYTYGSRYGWRREKQFVLSLSKELRFQFRPDPSGYHVVSASKVAAGRYLASKSCFLGE